MVADELYNLVSPDKGVVLVLIQVGALKERETMLTISSYHYWSRVIPRSKSINRKVSWQSSAGGSGAWTLSRCNGIFLDDYKYATISTRTNYGYIK